MYLNDTSSRRSCVEANFYSDAKLHAALLEIEAEKKALRTRIPRRCLRDLTDLQALACKSDEIGEHWSPRLQRAASDHQEHRRWEEEEADVEYVRVRHVHRKGKGLLILFEHNAQLSGDAADCADSSRVFVSPWADSPWENERSPLPGSLRLCGLIMGMLAYLCASANSWFTYQ